MADGVLPNEGIGALLEYQLSAPIPGVLPWELWFWVNDIVPDYTTVLADLIEASWGGYSRATLDRSGWSVPTVSAGCARSQWAADPLSWTVTSGPLETIYGYALVDRAVGVIRGIQRLADDDIQALVIGATVSIVPEFTLTSAAC